MEIEEFFKDYEVLSPLDTIKVIKYRLGRGDRFAVVRYGDGELFMMKDYVGKANNHINHPTLRDDLIETFRIKDSNFLICVNSDHSDKIFLGSERYKDQIAIIREFSQDKTYGNALVWHRTSLENTDELLDFLGWYLKKRVLVISHKRIKEFADKIGAEFVEIPERQAYYSMDLFMPEAMEKAKNCDVILVGGGIAGKIIVRDLYNTGLPIIVLDMGSWLEAFTGTINRSWLKRGQSKISEFKHKFYGKIQRVGR